MHAPYLSVSRVSGYCKPPEFYDWFKLAPTRRRRQGLFNSPANGFAISPSGLRNLLHSRNSRFANETDCLLSARSQIREIDRTRGLEREESEGYTASLCTHVGGPVCAAA